MIASEAFRVIVSDMYLGVDPKNHIVILQEETFYNSEGHVVYAHVVVIDPAPTKEAIFKMMLKKSTFAVRVSSAKQMTFDGRETREVIPSNDSLDDFLNDYSQNSPK